jgi:hypothetical protein
MYTHTQTIQQCTCDVTLGRHLSTTAAVEKQQALRAVSVCVALVIPHAPCHLWPALLNLFPHDLINGTTFEKKLLITSILILSTNF